MASGLITSFLGEGLAASRPADPDVASAIAFYWSTDTNEMSAWLENAWVEDVFGTGGALLAANNLSDLASAATARTNLGVGTGDSPQFTALNIGHASDTTVTRTGAGDIAVEGNAIYRAGGTDVPLADGGTGASLSDPGADRIMFWDDSAGAVTWLTPGTGLTITSTTIDASGGSGAPWYLASAPTAASLTLVSGDATNLTLADDSDVGLTIDAGTPVSGDKIRAAEKTISSPSSDWTFTIRMECYVSANNYSGFGITIRDTASGRLLMFKYSQTTFGLERFAALGGTFASTAFSNLTAGPRARWLRVVYDATGDILTFYTSPNGKVWSAIGTETRTTYLTNRPDRVGIGVHYNRTTGGNVVGSVDYLSGP